jgi:hypothetical protein
MEASPSPPKSDGFSLLLPKALLMWAIEAMSGVLLGNLVRRLD